MVDLNEHTMMFTLNGEVLLDDSGSELAFKDFETVEGQSRVIEYTHTKTHSRTHTSQVLLY